MGKIIVKGRHLLWDPMMKAVQHLRAHRFNIFSDPEINIKFLVEIFSEGTRPGRIGNMRTGTQE